MPELPEVETVRRGLEPAMVGKQIVIADVLRPNLRWPFPKDMSARLTGARVERLRRRSKYILGDLDTGETILIHLGMSGRMAVSRPNMVVEDILANFHQLHPTPERHDHVVLGMEDGTRIAFNDARRFGSMDLLATRSIEQHKPLAVLGPEPFGNAFDEAYLRATLKGKNSPIKSALLNQRVVAGLGNIYVCESLWRTGISPLRKVSSLSGKRIASLVPAIRQVLGEAIDSGGSSLRDYRQADGELGYFQHAFAVYGREGKPCKTSECKGLIKRIVQSGRSSFYCRVCQS